MSFCQHGKETHTFEVDLRCELCGHNKVTTIERPCSVVEDTIRAMRRVGCTECRNFLVMWFSCRRGARDCDYVWVYDGRTSGKLDIRVTNIDGG